MANKPTDNSKLWKTAAWLGFIIVAVLVLNPPQCPESYTQEQIDASGCIIGANIGLGIVMMFVAPVFIVVVGLLALAGYRHLRKSAKK